MTWTQLSFKEWQRRPLRTAITMTGVAIAIAALFSLLAFQRGYRDGVHQELDRLGAHVLVVPKGCPYDAASIALHGANWPCYLKESYLAEVRSVNGIATAAPCFMSTFYDVDGNQSVYVGVEPNILSLKAGWKIQGDFPIYDEDILAGSEMARHYGWKPGDNVNLPGLQGQTGRVAGVLAPTQGADDNFIFLGLANAQKRFNRPHEMTHVLVRLKDPNELDTVVAHLRGCDAGLAMNVIPLEHVYRTIQSFVTSTRLLLGCITLVALLVAGAGVSNTILIAVSERTREIGVMRAVGASRGHVFQLIWLETIQVCVSGALVGMGMAFLSSRVIESWVRSKLPFAPSGALIHWDWATAAGCLTCAVLLGGLAAFFPAWRAASVSPMLAIRAAGGRA
jgi:putative ABC transport system permease protein